MWRLILGVVVAVLVSPVASWAQQAQSTPQAQQESRPLGIELARGIAAPLLSAVYTPVKFSLGVTGAVLGGVSGFLTGGNERAAEGVWRPLTGGTYFITPQLLARQSPFVPFGDRPVEPLTPGPTPSSSMLAPGY
ncbi:MAG: hypothetical protein NZ578_06980 [Candidatus Binatia bacterium]|nr:hypothetical protein [Candidatus Binatia bacterium]